MTKLNAMPEHSTPRLGVVLFAHGSRDPLWHRPIEVVRDLVAQTSPDIVCVCAYLEISKPDLQSAIDHLVTGGCSTIHVLPMFLGTGRHAREDLPALVAACQQRHPQLLISVCTAVGEDPRVTRLLADIALDGIYKEHKS